MRARVRVYREPPKSVPAVPAITTAPDKLIIPATPIVKQTQCYISPKAVLYDLESYALAFVKHCSNKYINYLHRQLIYLTYKSY